MNSVIAAPVDWIESVGNLRFPTKADRRLQSLMDCNNEGLLTEGEREEMRLFPRILEKGDACVHATIDLHKLRWHRKHLRQMHQRRPDLYGVLAQDVRFWQDYPDIPWDREDYVDYVNKSPL